MVPDIAGLVVHHRILLTVGVAAEPGTYVLFDIVGHDGGIAPLVAFGAGFAGRVVVVHPSVGAGQCMCVGGGFFSEDAETAVAPALGHITEYLVVGFVFLDDVHDMLENTGFPDPLGDGHRCDVFPCGQAGMEEAMVKGLAEDCFGMGFERLRIGQGDDADAGQLIVNAPCLPGGIDDIHPL